jgi:hypothetical protein
MQAIEFTTTIENQQINIPSAYWNVFMPHTQVRIIVLIDEVAQEQQTWANTTTEQFLAGYTEEDAVYDKL